MERGSAALLFVRREMSVLSDGRYQGLILGSGCECELDPGRSIGGGFLL